MHQRLWKAWMNGNRFEDKERFVGRAQKSLKGIKESIYRFRIWITDLILRNWGLQISWQSHHAKWVGSDFWLVKASGFWCLPILLFAVWPLIIIMCISVVFLMWWGLCDSTLGGMWCIYSSRWSLNCRWWKALRHRAGDLGLLDPLESQTNGIGSHPPKKRVSSQPTKTKLQQTWNLVHHREKTSKFNYMFPLHHFALLIPSWSIWWNIHFDCTKFFYFHQFLKIQKLSTIWAFSLTFIRDRLQSMQGQWDPSIFTTWWRSCQLSWSSWPFCDHWKWQFWRGKFAEVFAAYVDWFTETRWSSCYKPSWVSCRIYGWLYFCCCKRSCGRCRICSKEVVHRLLQLNHNPQRWKVG